jgi:predicted acetyltransferase
LMEIRWLNMDDLPRHRRLMEEAFSGGMRSEEENIAPKISPILGAFAGTDLVAAATIHALHVTWGEHDAPLGGIAGVACTVGARGQGYVGQLMQESLRAMRDAGKYLSGLYPFSYAFYRRHGWDWVGEKRRYSVPTASIASTLEGRDVRTYDGPEARDAVVPVYEAFARRYRGMMTRQDPAPDWWTRRLEHGGGRTTYVHVHHDPVTSQADGYFTFRYSDGGKPAQIGEFFALTPDAYRGLLSVMHYYGTQAANLEFTAPSDDPLPLHVMHNDLSISVNPLFMGRIVDVSAALSALTPAPEVQGRLVLQVHDPSCDWNHGAFEVTLSDGRISAVLTQAAPGVTLDIQALTQAYWGQPSLALLRHAGRLSVSDEAQYRLLAALLPPAVPYLQDFF